jgi:hypothetical protein
VQFRLHALVRDADPLLEEIREFGAHARRLVAPNDIDAGVAAASHRQGDFGRGREQAQRERQVFAPILFRQHRRVGANHDALALLQAVGDCGQQRGEALAHPCWCFYHRRLPTLQLLAHKLRHLALHGARLEIGARLQTLERGVYCLPQAAHASGDYTTTGWLSAGAESQQTGARSFLSRRASLG